MPRQVIVHAPYDVRLDEIEPIERPLGDFEVLVHTEVSALSPGTETRIYTGLDAERFSYRVSYPFPLGYNNVGRVISVGTKVEGFRPGDRVFTRMPHVSDYIVSDRTVGDSSQPGSSNVPKSYDVTARVPDGVRSEQAVFTHLLTLGFNAMHRGGYRFGENVVVIGLGVVGLGAVCMGRLAGARVAAVGNHPLRLEAARAMGADEVWPAGDDDIRRAASFGGDEGVDVVMVCTDAWSALQTAVAISRRNTRIVVLAFPGVGQGKAPFDPFEPADFYNRSLSYIAASWMPTDDYPPEYQRFTVRRNYRYLLDLMARRRIDLSPMVTHHFPVSRVKEAFDLALSKNKEAIGIVFDWR